MRRAVLLSGVALSLVSTLALAAPESLLPDIFSNPAPEPSSQPTSAPVARATPTPAPAAAAPQSGAGSSPIVQPLPDSAEGTAPPASSSATIPEDFPSLAEIEAMAPEELDELLGLRPKFDIPPAARRAPREIGVLSANEGGMPLRSLAGQPASLVRAAIEGTKRPLVSRWGHILLRRTLASRLDAPKGMNAIQFAAMRAELLLRMGEGSAARALVQDIDSANYSPRLTGAAFNAYIATSDILGICPVARLRPEMRDDPQWEMSRLICAAYAGEGSRAGRELNRVLSRDLAPDIEVLLALRYAGAGGDGRRAVNIEWDDVDELSPWSYALATSLGVEVPENLWSNASYARWAAVSPAVPIGLRANAADSAAEQGIMSSAAMVDLYGHIHSVAEIEGPAADRAALLRTAYVADAPSARLAAMKSLWGQDTIYGRKVLTAYAAARLPVSAEYEADAAQLIASMLSAGLDANALRWGAEVSEGSQAWALLALAQPQRAGAVSSGAVSSFVGDDESPEQRKSQFLVAGLAGLDRMDSSDTANFGDQLGINLTRQSRWSSMITKAADAGNPTLVSLLAGLGMQGSGWDKMTARHLYHIVRSLNRVGLSAEARMIAAEAVARG